MDPVEAKVLKVKNMDLQKSLHVKGTILDYLQSNSIVGETQYEDIMKNGGVERSRDDMARQLLAYLPHAGREAFSQFVAALEYDDGVGVHQQLAQLLKEGLQKERGESVEKKLDDEEKKALATASYT
eukprot:scpid90610/ scgid15953/ 